MELFREFHDFGKSVRSLNTTFLFLIAKKRATKDVKYFRLISLVGCIYKIILKVLTNRLSKVIGEIIGECQHAFMGGRQILEAIMVVNTLVDELISGKKEGILCKFDIEKIYDHVSWNVLEYMMERMGSCQKWMKWMRSCITTTSFTILVNGCPSRFSSASRGLCQGNPLSPLLFLIVMEALNPLIGKTFD